MAGKQYQQDMADLEVPMFMLGAMLKGLPGIIGASNENGCYKFMTAMPGMENFYFYVERKDFVIGKYIVLK